MTKYTFLDNCASFSSKPSRITGQYLARAHLSQQQRAELAAALTDGSVEIFPLTGKQAAVVARVSAVDVTRARRAANGNGKLGPNGGTESLAAHIARSTPAERIEAARTVGVGIVWDSMLAPAISIDDTAE